MIRFLDGLNTLIVNTLHLQTYIDLKEAIHKVVENKQQYHHWSRPFNSSQYFRGTSSNYFFKNSKLLYATNTFFPNVIKINLLIRKVELQWLLLHLQSNPIGLVIHKNNKELVKLSALSARGVVTVLMIVSTRNSYSS